MKNIENKSLIPIARLGYRPYTGDYPQQSLESYKQAYEKNHRIFLCDIRLTSDGKTVCCHDDDISRVGARLGECLLKENEVLISATELNELLKYDFSSDKGNIKPLPILQLEDFMRLCAAYPDVTPCLELKVDLEDKIDYIVSLVKKYNFEKNIMFICGEKNARIVAKMLPKSIIGDWVYAATDGIIEKLASYGVKTFVYVGKEGKQPETINEKTYAKAKALGVDLGYTYISNREHELFDRLKKMGIFKYCKYVGLDEPEWLEE